MRAMQWAADISHGEVLHKFLATATPKAATQTFAPLEARSIMSLTRLILDVGDGVSRAIWRARWETPGYGFLPLDIERGAD